VTGMPAAPVVPEAVTVHRSSGKYASAVLAGKAAIKTANKQRLECMRKTCRR
jgi:hypothetical protein